MKIVAAITGAALAALLGLVPADALAQCCGDCNGDGTVTVDEILTAVNHALTSCSDDGICSQCGVQRFPASGQTTAYGPGSDGAVRAGAALSYTDNGDGTITDNNTGLMWEKKDRSGGIHDWSSRYTWGMTSSPYTMNGTMVTSFLATLNAGTGFAGHTDWRIPNVKELQSIVSYEIPYPGPAVDGTFNTDCAASCSVLTCSCTQSFGYWSSTTGQYGPGGAWVVYFDYGFVGTDGKDGSGDVRAVRGGL
jgi:hypothetical protein